MPTSIQVGTDPIISISSLCTNGVPKECIVIHKKGSDAPQKLSRPRLWQDTVSEEHVAEGILKHRAK